MTSRALRPLVVLVVAALAVVAASFAAPALRAQEGAAGEDVRRRVQWVRELPKEERARLKAALERFRGLPPAEREALRRRAAKLGPERLDALAGRDLGQLARRRDALGREVDRVMEALGEQRLAELTPEERAYVRAEATRGFERHIRRRLLELQTFDEFERMSGEERRAKLRDALRRAIDARLAAMPDEERERILALPPREQAEERARLFAEYRMDETQGFARIFERHRFEPFLKMPPERRAERARRWRERSRWPELARVLREDFGVGETVRRDLAALGPAEWAKVVAELQATEALPLDDRRTRIEQLVHRLAGERAVAPPRRPLAPPLLQRLRERRLSAPDAPPR